MRPVRLISLLSLALTAFILPSAVVAQPAPAQDQQTPSPAQPKPANPFEAVPVAPSDSANPAAGQAKPQSPFEAPRQSPEEKVAGENVIEAIEFEGNRRVPQATLRSMIFTKPGDFFNEQQLRADFMSLWNTARFDDIRLESEPGPRGGKVVRFVLVERRVIRSIKYEGVKSATVSEILDRFKERRVGLTVESQYDPAKVQRASVVLKEFLAERGRQYAEVEPEIVQIPPSSLAISFVVKEGPKVKVGEIEIEGNQAFSDKAVKRAMKNLKPIGIPYSLLFENLFSRTFDRSKLEEDKSRIQNFYQERGYFMARVTNDEVTMRDSGGGGFKIPLFYPNKPGKKADISLTVNEGRLYKLNKINFEGVKLFRTPQSLMGPLFGMNSGDIFSIEKLRKGLESMRKLYGEFGYIDFVPEPIPEPIPNTDLLDLTLSVEEGKQFFVRRIDFQGNTTTRDKVIRREILLDEGDLYNTRLWEVSILRLNQLGYFEKLEKDESAEIRRDSATNTVDITLKVKERGKNTIGLTGGVSGIAGTFFGFNYATNNFLGLGETLSFDAQIGDRIRDVTFGFTEPYLFDRPITTGFSIYQRRFNFDQGREVSILTGRNLIPIFNAIGQGNLLNYVSNGGGISIFASYPLRRTFARLGLSYGYDRSNISVGNDSTKTYFEFLNFQGLNGPNSLNGIITSRVVPSYTFNTIDHPITPTQGRSLFLSTSLAGFGGNVKMISPTLEFKYFRKGFRRGHVIGTRVLGSLVTGYSGQSSPPFNRFFVGGEQDIRGFEIWSVSPVAYIPSERVVNVLNADGSARLQKIIDSQGNVSFSNVTQRVPHYQFIFPGGDTQGIVNFEYRIPIVGPLTLAAFFDAGINKLMLPGQLRLNDGRISELNSLFPTAGFQQRAVIAPGTQQMRTSTGLELQVIMPVVNAPFRLYYAYNPTILEQILIPPVSLDRSQFPNEASFLTAFRELARPLPYVERRTMFRFTISRTF